MFDNLQKQAEDIFAKTDEVSPHVLPPSQPADVSNPQREPPAVPSKRSFPWKPILIVVVILIVIVTAFLLSVRILRSRTALTPKAPSEQTQQKEEVKEQEPAEEPVEQVSPEPAQQSDTDKDGLMDDEEASLGTDSTQEDTDNDGLFDREEVEVYQTNPLNSDSDNDTYLDGAEVKAGYDPNGPGKLFEVPQKE